MEPFRKDDAGVPKKQDQNMQELLNLLGPTSNNAAPQQQQVVRPQPPQAAARPQSVPGVQPKQRQPPAAAIARAQMLRQYQMQQAQLRQRQALQQKQQQQQRVAAAAVAAPSTASQGVVNELEELMRTNTAPQARPPQAQPQQVTQAQQQRRPVSAPSNNRSAASVVSGQSSRRQQQNPAPNQPAAVSGGRPAATQEQVIVMHFCRYALARLTKLTAGLENSAELIANLQSAIKRLWTEWVANRITKTALLETIARIVRGSCPAAANVSVVSDFRAWLSAQRTNRAVRGNPPTQPAGAVRQAGTPQAAPGPQTTAGLQFAGNAAAIPQTQQQIMMQRQRQVAAQQAAMAAGINNIGANQAKVSVTHNVNRVNPDAYAAAALAQQRAAAIRAHQMRQARPGVVSGKVGGPNVKNEQMMQGMVPGGANVNMAGKRLANPSGLRMAQKKARAGGKFQKSPSKVRKTVPVVMGAPPVAIMPPMRRGMASAGRLNPTAIPANLARPGPGAVQQSVQPGVIQPVVAASVDPKKPSKKTIDNDLNVVDSIVDIDNEQNALVGGSQIIHELNMHENEEDFSKNLLLDAKVVRAKVEKAMAKHGLTGGVSKEIIELISHSFRERLIYAFENVAEQANARVESIEKNRGKFVSRDAQKDVRQLLDEMRDDEEKALTAAAMKRTSQWRKEVKERSAGETAENSKNTEANKSDKAAQAEADKKKKAKAAVEKKKAADSLQRSALSGAISGITKKRKKKAILAPLMLGAAAKSVSGKTTSSASKIGSLNTATITATTSNPAAAQPVNNNVTANNAIANKAAGKKSIAGVTRTVIKLEDCLAFFGNESNMRQSALVYKWYARLYAPPPV